jgi:hypothetical protein
MNPFGDTEREKYLYEKGIADGSSHSQPSTLTQKNMETLNIDLAVMREQIKTIHHQLLDNKDSQKENKEQHQMILDKIDKFIDTAEKKFADNDDFQFWKKVLITGIILSIALAVAGMWLEKILK